MDEILVLRQVSNYTVAEFDACVIEDAIALLRDLGLDERADALCAARESEDWEEYHIEIADEAIEALQDAGYPTILENDTFIVGDRGTTLWEYD